MESPANTPPATLSTLLKLAGPIMLSRMSQTVVGLSDAVLVAHLGAAALAATATGGLNSYTVLIHRVVAIYCVLLPFGLAHTIRFMTPVVVMFVAYAFFGLDAIGDEIEQPFGRDVNDLPLYQLSRMIEANVRKRVGDTDLPPPVKPHRGVLL